ncbi:hypothetical protein Dsin_002789 [Dipteronia sinensis]|uniref:Glycosyltransferase N-terminal domain-containing protein n=1 Tax=Dipteronia sinensis TaxID=43782 RepID=A0AAE0B6I2_9ROSI|nr:hypothetical protein Dsin_002789 [Dipteronia sinensis]
MEKPPPHAVFVPFPAQGHINPMLKLAKLLNLYRGFHITFVNTEYNYNRVLKSSGPDSLNGTATFCFETIPDGLPLLDANAVQDFPSLWDSIKKTCLAPFRQLLSKLNNTYLSNVPPVTCIVSVTQNGISRITSVTLTEHKQESTRKRIETKL